MKDVKVTYSVESSYDHEDIDKEHEECIVVVADGGEEYGTMTVTTIDGMNNMQTIKDLVEHFNDPQF